MSCKISYSERFAKDMKRLAKRHRSIGQDYILLLESLRENPKQGVDLGRNLRKVRMAIASKGKGKSGGARVITCTLLIEQTDSELLLLTVYDKSDRESLTDSELKALLKECGLL